MIYSDLYPYFKIVKVQKGNGNYTRLMSGKLAQHIDIDLQNFSLGEIAFVLQEQILPHFDDCLQVEYGQDYLHAFYSETDHNNNQLIILDIPLP